MRRSQNGSEIVTSRSSLSSHTMTDSSRARRSTIAEVRPVSSPTLSPA